MEPLPIDAEGRFSGYASVFGRTDEGGDMMMPGAFRKSLALRGRHRVRMLFQHDPKEPVGTWDAIREDDYGLWVTGRLVPEVPRAEALRRLIAKGAVDGLSIGFRTIKANRGCAQCWWRCDAELGAAEQGGCRQLGGRRCAARLCARGVSRGDL